MVDNKIEILKFMLDTVAYNKLYNNQDWLLTAIKSLQYGFSFYKTTPQDWELNGWGAKIYDENCEPKYHNQNIKLPDFSVIDSKLNVKNIPCGVNLMKYHTLLDGTSYAIDSNSKEGHMFKEILEFNSNLRKNRPFAQHYDAFIAESAIHNDCILVTDDTHLLSFVNKHFDKRAITTENLISKIKSKLQD